MTIHEPIAPKNSHIVHKKNIYISLGLFFCLCLLSGCASSVERYISDNQNLDSEKILAMRRKQIISGMTQKEVTITLGEPTFRETKKGKQRWIYRMLNNGKNLSDVYTPASAFPQGIAYVIPLYYTPQELRIDFCQGKVCRIQEILSFKRAF